MTDHRCPVCAGGVLCYAVNGMIFCDTCITFFKKKKVDDKEVLVEDERR